MSARVGCCDCNDVCWMSVREERRVLVVVGEYEDLRSTPTLTAVAS